jgi:hypothetical protein
MDSQHGIMRLYGPEKGVDKNVLSYAWIPWSVFSVCCLLQWWLLTRIKQLLIERHPNTYVEVQKASPFPFQGLYWLMRKNRYKNLDDIYLNKKVRDFKRLYFGGLAAWLCGAIMVFTA